jgi:GDP-mannose 6-dehydrogenase
MRSSDIAVFGLGYVGCVSAACLAELGHRVLGVDRDLYKVECVNAGRAPFFEPGLQEIVRATAAAGRLRATASAAEGVAQSNLALICVGTPSERNGNIGLEQLRRVVEQIAAELGQHPKPYILAIRSTVFPGTCEEIVLPAISHLPDVHAVSNPEFLREGSAVKDFRQPPLTVVGGMHAPSMETVAGLYESLGAAPSLVTLRSAEMIKYACNIFHAVKINFANEIGAVCDRLGIPALEVMQTLCQDTTLNISSAYLRPGFAFGGSCLPKDLRAVNYRASRLDLKLPMLESLLESNHQQLRRAIQRVEDLPGKIGVIGLAFKENTDDLRESPVVALLEHLIGRGRELRVWDPQIRLECIYGSNREYILNSIPHIGRLLSSSVTDLLTWGAAHLVLTQRPSEQLRQQLADTGKPVVDLSGWL